MLDIKKTISYQQLYGIWRTRGYNKIFEIRPDEFIIHSLSEISLVEIQRGSPEIFERVFDRFETVGEGSVAFFARGGITRLVLERQAGMQEFTQRIQASRKDDPTYNFDVFWYYLKENYAFFVLRGVNWDQVYRDFRPRVSIHTKKEELIAILREVIIHLGDSHVTLSVAGESLDTRKPHALVRHWMQEFQSTDFLQLYLPGVKKLSGVLQEKVLHGHGKSALNGQVVWGMLEGSIAYLGLLSLFDLYASHSLLSFAGFEVMNSDYAERLDFILDEVMHDLGHAQAMIIDIRTNLGGHDPAGFLIASRFNDRERLAFTKKAVDGGCFTPAQEIILNRSKDQAFTRPVMLLTSEATASAAEAFTLAMMSLPHVTRMGTATRGVLSDMLAMCLPNSWEVTLSNEVYTARDGRVYEGMGIPPDIPAPVFFAEDFYGKMGVTVEQAKQYLIQKLSGM
jgi:carboxyl-terminal processing protease